MLYQKQNSKTFRQLKIIKRLYALKSLEASKNSIVSTPTITRDMKQISSVISLGKASVG